MAPLLLYIVEAAPLCDEVARFGFAACPSILPLLVDHQLHTRRVSPPVIPRKVDNRRQEFRLRVAHLVTCMNLHSLMLTVRVELARPLGGA